MKLIISMIALVVLSGCTGVSPYIHEKSKDDGTIHVFRKSQFNAGGVGAVFYVDGQNILKLGTKEYAEVPIAPGERTISVKGDQTAKRDDHIINVQNNEKLFYEIKANPNRLKGAFLIPLVDMLGVKTFVLEKSDSSTYEEASKTYNKEKLKYANKASHDAALDSQ